MQARPSILRGLILGLLWRWQRLQDWLRPWRVAVRWILRRSGTPHGLPGTLVVSLTSYPPRFPTVALTLRCLLTQSIKPDHVILWIAHADEARLPPEVLALRALGLEIRSTEDLRSFKKIVPALRDFPDAFIVTADDDVY